MEWVKLSTRYYLDPAVAGLPDADAELLFVRALAYAGAEETGGFIPEAVIPSLCRRRRWRPLAEAIAASSLWAPGRDDLCRPGYQVSRWQDWQEELEALARRRASDRDRKRRERERRAVDNQGPPRKRGRPPKEKPAPETAKPQVKNMSRDMSADSPQIPSRSKDLDLDFDFELATQVSHPADRNARARDADARPGDPWFRARVIAAFIGKTGIEISEATADAIAADVLGKAREPVRHPLPFVLAAIENESGPVARWLRGRSAPAPERPPHCGDRECNPGTRRREHPETGADAGPCPKCSGDLAAWRAS